MPQLLYYLEVDKDTNIVKEEISDGNSGQQETEEAKKDDAAKKVSIKAVNRKQMVSTVHACFMPVTTV